ncbi:hypothetical protein ACFFJY_17320 [Fictibacillus aquaticus]|uniref:Uncharacterized protein n=1 Tax=Fictibacillus aquaticus TaxID=2021314 RepID=A0A235F6J6_9BACL|nr:hypothetical protein [Fictibacillus aquaticus]OYD56693.1 hypothetical protein CGZ90_16935 [Fictibacillus aquaticus]
MSVAHSTLREKDAFLCTPAQVSQAIAAYFEGKGFSIQVSENKSDVDVIASSGSIRFFIESRANQAYKYQDTDKVFDSSKLDVQFAEQIEQIMRFQQQNLHSKTTFFIMGNPDIKRLRNRIAKVDKMLDKLGIIRCWVKENGEVEFEGENAFLLELSC